VSVRKDYLGKKIIQSSYLEGIPVEGVKGRSPRYKAFRKQEIKTPINSSLKQYGMSFFPVHLTGNCSGFWHGIRLYFLFLTMYVKI